MANGSSSNLKLWKTQLHKMRQSRWFLGRILRLKNRLLLIKSILKPWPKSVWIPLKLTAAASATDSAIHKKMFGSGNTTILNSNE